MTGRLRWRLAILLAFASALVCGVTATAVAAPPVGVDDYFSVDEDSVLILPHPNALGNDYDPDGTTVECGGMWGGTFHSVLNWVYNGDLVFAPVPDYNGPDQITYWAMSGGEADAATIYFTVNPVQDAPVALADSGFTCDEDSSVFGAGNLLANDYDVDGEPLQAYLDAGASHGVVTVYTDGTFDYTATDPEYNGPDSFTYHVSDGIDDSAPVTVDITVGEVNDAPTVSGADVPVVEDSAAYSAAWGTFAPGGGADEGAQSVTVSDVSNDNNALFSSQPTVLNDGTLQFTPGPDANGTAQVTVTVVDDGTTNGAPDPQTGQCVFTITVNPVQDAPVAVADSGFTCDEDSSVLGAGNLLANDYDVDGESLQAYLDTGASHGVVTVHAGGTFDYAATDPDYNGPDSFTYYVSDGIDNSAPVTVDITVNPVNDAPVAGDYDLTWFHLTEDNWLWLNNSVLIGAATDVDGDPLSVVAADGPNMTETLDGVGIEYDPAPDFFGDEYVIFTISDGSLTDTATLTLHVDPVNDAPVAVADGGYSCDEDMGIIGAASVLANDTDVEADPLAAYLDSGASHGTVTLYPDGTFDYTALEANYNGPDSFTYHADDGNGGTSAPVTVDITVDPVNDAPVAIDQDWTWLEVAERSFGDIWFNSMNWGTDVDGDPVTVTAYAADNAAVGMIDFWVVYYFSSDYFGVENVYFEVSDGLLTDDGTMQFTITPVNDAPVANSDAPPFYACDEDSSFDATFSVLSNDTDVEGDALSATLVTDAAHGTVTLGPLGTFTYVATDPNYNGPDSFWYTAFDGMLPSEPAQVHITVSPVDDPPVPVADEYTLPEDGVFSVAAPGILANDITYDGETLEAWGNSDTTNGFSWAGWGGDCGYTPDADFVGDDVMTYLLIDVPAGNWYGGGVATFHVTEVNDAPTISGDDVTADEDSGAYSAAWGTFGPGGGPDESGQAVTVTSVTNDNNALFSVQPTVSLSGQLDFTPATDANGSAVVTLEVTDDGTSNGVPDPLTTTRTFTITVNSVDDAPVGVADEYWIPEGSWLEDNVLSNDYDVDGDLTGASWWDGPYNSSFGWIAWDGYLWYEPDTDFAGDDWFGYYPEDSTGLYGGYTTVTIHVTEVNDAPTIAGGDVTVDEDFGAYSDAAWGSLGTGGGADEAGQAVTVTSVTNDNNALFGSQPIVLDDGTLEFTPAPNAYGSASVTVEVADDGTTNGAPDPQTGTTTFLITVDSVNDAPVGAGDSYAIDEDATLLVSTPDGVLVNDSDVEGDPLAVSMASWPVNGDVLLTDGGGFMYKPDADFQGVDSFAYWVTDGLDTSGPVTVDITVNGVNDPPVITAGTSAYVTCSEDNNPTPFALTLDATDAEGDALVWSLAGSPSNGTASASAAGPSVGVSYAPKADWSGSDAFMIAVEDGNGGMDTVLVHVNVAPWNDAPVAVDDEFTTSEDTPIVIPFAAYLANDYDIEGNGPDWFDWPWLVSGPVSSWDFCSPSYGDFTMVPAADAVGDVVFGYNLFDWVWDPVNYGWFVSNDAFITIHVTPVNDAPYFDAVADVTVDEDSGPYSTAWVSGISVGPANESAQAFTFETTNDNEALFATQPEVAADGTLGFEPAADADGTANVTLVITDDDTMGGPALTFTRTFVITVNPGNDAPDAVDDEMTVDEDSIANVGLVLGNDTDPEGDALTVTGVTQGAHGSVTFDDTSVGYTPDAGYDGPDSFTYTITDGTDTDVATVEVTVLPGNDAPVATGEAYTTDEDVAVTVTFPGVLGNDVDPDGDAMTPTLVTPPANGALELRSDGSFTYVPSTGWSGSDSFTYSASDGALSSGVVTVSLTVDSVDTAYTGVAGATRVQTAISASGESFPSGAATVLIATSLNWPDSLGGSGLAGAVGGPILITPPQGLDAGVSAEITRLGATKAYVLGGVGAVPAVVFDQLVAKLGAANVVRLGGIDRYATAALIAAEAVARGADGSTVMLATGRDFPDAVAAAPISYAKGWPLLLAHPTNGVTTSTRDAMTAVGADHVVVLGNYSSVSAATQAQLGTLGYTTERVSGSDKYSTSVAIAQFGVFRGGLSWDGLAIATGDMFPDALSGGPFCGSRNAVLILNPSTTLHPVVASALQAHRSEINEVYYLGGTGALSQGVRDQVTSILR